MSSGRTATTSSCSCGKTSRNQPKHPDKASTQPSTLTDVLVTRPANSSATPTAKMNGHAVGAGTSISRRVRVSFSGVVGDGVGMYSSASKNVNHGEHHNPHGIDEMPVHREHFDVIRLLHSHTTSKAEDRNHREHDETCCDVKGMQADEREVRCSEEVGRDCESMFVNQPVPFQGRAVEKQATQRNGQQPQ